MPKEMIKDHETQHHALEVCWGRAPIGSVGLATKFLPMDGDVASLHAVLDGEPLPVLAAPPGGEAWVHLSRADVNRLIRVLRKARDQAFGADA